MGCFASTSILTWRAEKGAFRAPSQKQGGARDSDGQGHEAVVVLDVSLEDVRAGTQHTLEPDQTKTVNDKRKCYHLFFKKNGLTMDCMLGEHKPATISTS